MRQKNTLLLGSLLAYCFIAPRTTALADDRDRVVGDVGKAISQYVDTVHQRLGFSGVVLAGRDGQVVAALSRGWSDEKTQRPLRVTSLLEIASCTKSFTAVALLKLAEQGELSLDDPISQHLPDVPENCHSITVRHLLMHTSGIPGTNTKGTGDDITKVLPTFLAGGPKTPPGERHEYWNQGYALLSEIIARTSGQSYIDAMNSLVLDPCQMHASLFTGDSAPRQADVATGYSANGPSRSAHAHPYGTYGFQYRGMGGLVTNVDDLWKWDRALASGKLLNEASLQEMLTPGPGDYAIGWRCGIAVDGTPCHYHSGSVRGFVSDMHRYPSIDGAVFILSNRNDTLALQVLQQGVDRILFGKRNDVTIPHSPDRNWLTQITGHYTDSKDRKLIIASKQGLPTIQIHWGGPVTRGYVGLNDQGDPHLYMLKVKDNAIDFTDDGELLFDVSDDRCKAVSLGAINPPLEFTR